MDDIKTQPKTPVPESNVPDPSAPQQEPQPQPGLESAAPPPEAEHEQKPDKPVPTPPSPKPEKISTIPVVPIFIAIVMAGGMIAIAVFLALDNPN